MFKQRYKASIHHVKCITARKDLQESADRPYLECISTKQYSPFATIQCRRAILHWRRKYLSAPVSDRKPDPALSTTFFPNIGGRYGPTTGYAGVHEGGGNQQFQQGSGNPFPGAIFSHQHH
jgi:hypothetical protein